MEGGREEGSSPMNEAMYWLAFFLPSMMVHFTASPSAKCLLKFHNTCRSEREREKHTKL